MITIVNYGMGNLGSVQNMLKRIGVPNEVTGDITRIEKASKILLPGVGSYDAAMECIHTRGLSEVLNFKALEDKVPVLGICLGMQLLTKSSEEGVQSGLGWIDAITMKFKFSDKQLKVPHMGWNTISSVIEHPLTNDLPADPRFYFVHSYYVRARDNKNVLAETFYGHPFHSMIIAGNIMGAQFHPEKSHKFGMKLLENFSRL